MKKDLTKIYLEAARMVAEGEQQYSCIAVKYASPNSDDLIFYASTFGFVLSLSANLTRDERVLCLCLMAAAWKDLR